MSWNFEFFCYPFILQYLIVKHIDLTKESKYSIIYLIDAGVASVGRAPPW